MRNHPRLFGVNAFNLVVLLFAASVLLFAYFLSKDFFVDPVKDAYELLESPYREQDAFERRMAVGTLPKTNDKRAYNAIIKYEIDVQNIKNVEVALTYLLRFYPEDSVEDIMKSLRRRLSFKTDTSPENEANPLIIRKMLYLISKHGTRSYIPHLNRLQFEKAAENYRQYIVNAITILKMEW